MPERNGSNQLSNRMDTTQSDENFVVQIEILTNDE
jgi:hypothetical protein